MHASDKYRTKGKLHPTRLRILVNLASVDARRIGRCIGYVLEGASVGVTCGGAALRGKQQIAKWEPNKQTCHHIRHLHLLFCNTAPSRP